MGSRLKLLADYVSDVQHQIGATAAAVYILQNGKVVLESYTGRHDHSEESRPVDARTQFNVASIRKTYLALAVSLLIEDGLIKSIDDPVTNYLEGLPDIVRGVTLRHLVTHTHGLVEDNGQPASIFSPGYGWVYNNVGINLLYKILCKQSQMPLSEFIRRTVFEPYELHETGWRTTPQEEFIYNYYKHPNNWVGPNDSGLGDQGNLFVSARDLATWGQIHLLLGADHGGRQILPKSVFQRVTSCHTPVTIPMSEPRNGYIWWLQHNTPHNQIGEQVPPGAYQVLGLTGCALLVIPAYDVVAVRMYNQLANPAGYDYLADIRRFGNMVCQAVQ